MTLNNESSATFISEMNIIFIWRVYKCYLTALPVNKKYDKTYLRA